MSDITGERKRAAGWPSEAERFADRSEAGQALALAIADHLGPPSPTDHPLVLALPRGGVPVGHEVAKVLGAELDVVVARQVGLPWQPNFGVGAIADEGPAIFDHNALACVGMNASDLAPAVRRERLEVRRRQLHYRGDRPLPATAGRTVIVVDDGLAPGMSARAAVRAVRGGDPAQIIFAAPVCAAQAADWLRTEADSVIHLRSPREFYALGLWYRDFTPLTDDDVATILALTWKVAPTPVG